MKFAAKVRKNEEKARFLLLNKLIDAQCNKIKNNACDQSGDGIDGIMCINIHRRKAHENVEWQHDEREPSATGAEGQQHDDCGDTDMAAREGGGRSFSCVVRQVKQVVAEAVAPSWCCHAFAMGKEPITKVGENALCNSVSTYSEVVELRSGNGQ